MHLMLQGRRRDADEEPVAYHAFPLKAAPWLNNFEVRRCPIPTAFQTKVEEVFSEFNISHMLDLTCCNLPRYFQVSFS